MLSKLNCVQSGEFGRYLESNSHFDKGDVVWEESPLITGPVAILDLSPGQDCKFSCVSCHKEVNDGEKCYLCDWPCCSSTCSQNEIHQKLECKIFSKLGIKVTSATVEHLIYLRILLCKDVYPEKYEKFLALCFKDYENDANLKRKREEETNRIWTFVAELCKVNVTMEEVSRVYSAFQTNSFDFSHKQNGFTYSGEAAYLYGSLFAHSCEQNCEFLFLKNLERNGQTIWVMRVVARKTVEQGDMLTIAYSDGHLKFGTIVRQRRIFTNYDFLCLCIRCKDKTEGGTFFQAMVCPECGIGYLLPVDAINVAGGLWNCDKCEFTLHAKVVRTNLRNLQTIPYALLKKKKGDAESLKLADEYLDTKVALLHSNHYLMNICAMHWLLQRGFTEELLSPGKASRTLFAKFMGRVDTYLPLCLKFMPYAYSADLYMTVSKAYAAYTLKSADMRTFEDEQFPVFLKLRLCRRIASFIKESLEWKKFNPNGLTHSNMNVYIRWAKRATDFEMEILQQEELASMSVRYLFN